MLTMCEGNLNEGDGSESKWTRASKDIIHLASFNPRLTQMRVCWDWRLMQLDSGEGQVMFLGMRVLGA